MLSLGQKDYCYKCGTPWRKTWANCGSCGSSDKSQGSARPTEEVSIEAMHFDGPWRYIPWPEQGSVAIYGGPGTGKSSLSALLRPSAWITSEQEPKPVRPMFNRLTPGHMPVVYPANTVDRFQEIMDGIGHGPVVVDSLTGFGRNALTVAKIMVAWAHEHDDRVLGILQLTKQGDAAGVNELPHLVDAVIGINKDASGLRMFNIEKSRWCPEENHYWTFGKSGQIVLPDFPASYSVEGTTNFHLQPFPMGRPQWADLLLLLDRLDLLRPKMASAAHYAHYMPQHFLEPRDVDQRRRFAENVGLTWVDPAEIWEEIQDAMEKAEIMSIREIMKG